MRQKLRAIVYPILICAIVFFLSGTNPKVPKEITFIGFDKFIHFMIFGVMAVAWNHMSIGKTRFQHALFAVLLTSAYGALDEFHQSFTPGRSVEFADWIADTSGAIVFCSIYNIPFIQKLAYSKNPIRTLKAFWKKSRSSK